MVKKLKHFRLSDDTLQRIADVQKQLGIENETAVIEIMLKNAHDNMLGVSPHAEAAAKSHTETK